jgi:hypothetical protein
MRGDERKGPSAPAQGTHSKSNGVVLDLDGHSVSPLADHDSKAVVLIFVSTDCPVANRYAPEIGRLCDTYRSKKVAFWLVYADPSEGPAKIRKHLNDFHHKAAAVRDPEHRLVERCGATKTPEAVVFSAGARVYRGRIDDRYTDYGKSRSAATQHDLQEALDAVLAGRPVKTPITKTIGCYIPDAER